MQPTIRQVRGGREAQQAPVVSLPSGISPGPSRLLDGRQLTPCVGSFACPSCRQLVLSAPEVAREEQQDSVFHQMQASWQPCPVQHLPQAARQTGTHSRFSAAADKAPPRQLSSTGRPADIFQLHPLHRLLPGRLPGRLPACLCCRPCLRTWLRVWSPGTSPAASGAPSKTTTASQSTSGRRRCLLSRSSTPCMHTTAAAAAAAHWPLPGRLVAAGNGMESPIDSCHSH